MMSKPALAGNHSGFQPNSPEVEAFLAEIVATCQRHKLSLSHEDEHGAFRVIPYDKNVEDWLLDAFDET